MRMVRPGLVCFKIAWVTKVSAIPKPVPIDAKMRVSPNNIWTTSSLEKPSAFEFAAVASLHSHDGGPGNCGELSRGPFEHAHLGDGTHTRDRHSESAWFF